jgi:hypothetical protein
MFQNMDVLIDTAAGSFCSSKFAVKGSRKDLMNKL